MKSFGIHFGQRNEQSSQGTGYQVPGTWKLKKYWLSGRIGWKGVMAVGTNDERWEDLIRRLRALSEDKLAAVRAFVEELARHERAVQDAQAPYAVRARAAEETVRPDEPERQTVPQLATVEKCLDFLAFGPPGFLPGELDQLLADIEHMREMELDTPCQPT
jgi:hypothetical protein